MISGIELPEKSPIFGEVRELEKSRSTLKDRHFTFSPLSLSSDLKVPSEGAVSQVFSFNSLGDGYFANTFSLQIIYITYKEFRHEVFP